MALLIPFKFLQFLDSTSCAMHNRITQDEHRMFIQLTLRPDKDALVGNLSEIKIKCSSPQTTQMVTLI